MVRKRSETVMVKNVVRLFEELNGSGRMIHNGHEKPVHVWRASDSRYNTRLFHPTSVFIYMDILSLLRRIQVIRCPMQICYGHAVSEEDGVEVE